MTLLTNLCDLWSPWKKSCWKWERNFLRWIPSELFESKWQTWCLVTPKFFCVYFLKTRTLAHIITLIKLREICIKQCYHRITVPLSNCLCNILYSKRQNKQQNPSFSFISLSSAPWYSPERTMPCITCVLLLACNLNSSLTRFSHFWRVCAG